MAHALRDYPLEVVHYAAGEFRLVHRINVNMVDAVRKKVDDLLGRIRNARAKHCIRIVAEPVDDRAEARGKMRSRKLAYPRNLPPAENSSRSPRSHILMWTLRRPLSREKRQAARSRKG